MKNFRLKSLKILNICKSKILLINLYFLKYTEKSKSSLKFGIFQ